MGVRELYEEFPFPVEGHDYDFLGKYVFPHAPLRPARVLDAGCGTGHMAVELAARLPSTQVVGVDFSEASLANARRLAQGRGISNVDFRHQDLMEAFRPGERYDFAISIGCLHHIPDPALALRRIRAVLSGGALLIVGVYGKYGRIETEMRRELLNLLREVTGRTTAELIPVCRRILSEPSLRENSLYKINTLLMPLTDPRRFASLIKRRVFRRGRAGGADRVPGDISVADQYMHPFVLNWTAGEWLRAIESAGLRIERFIYEPAAPGICIPWDAMARIRDPGLRSLLDAMSPNKRYEALELIFRPSMHMVACTPSA